MGEIFLDDGDVRLYQGDVETVLAGMPDESVDCVVTSPPYWGLRDYGTGLWDGGDPDCDHVEQYTDPTKRPASGGVGNTSAERSAELAEQQPNAGAGGRKLYRETCDKCGARRVDQQLGLEPTPDLYVERIVSVFREIRRVLAAHGTCWVNLGDSYAGANWRPNAPSSTEENKWRSYAMGTSTPEGRRNVDGLKQKDLVGVPWAVAKALQEPYYTGRIKRERDRVWLAATIDAEGSICGFTHERADGDGTRTGVHITITNTSMPLLAEAQRIWPTSREDGNAHGPSALGTRECRRWIAHNVDDKAQLLRELYPYLIAKKAQALLAWNFLEMSRVSKRIGKVAEGAQARERRAWIVKALSDLNHGRGVDIPGWIVEPEGMWEGGWFLRSEIIWAKLCRTLCPNPSLIVPLRLTSRFSC